MFVNCFNHKGENLMRSISRLRLTKLIIFSLVVTLSFTTQVSAQEYIDNKGREFIMTFLNNLGAPSTELHLTSDVATSVTVEYPFAAPTFSTTVPVNPGTVTVVVVPNSSADSWTLGAVQDNAVHAFSDDEFVCYMINRLAYTSDAALALPVDAMNRDFIVATYSGATVHSSDAGEFAFVASVDGTEVTVTPTNALSDGHPAGVPFVVNLNRGQAYYNQTATGYGVAGDLTGTLIESNFPIGMTNGNLCTNVPSSVWACDHIFEVAQPLQSWGNRVFVANLPQRTGGSFYRIIAGADNTTVLQDGVPIGVIDKGDFIEVQFLTGNHVFEANNAIFVVQFMPGDSNPGATQGDPAMGNIAPSEQFLYSYTFSTVGGSQFASNYLSIIAHNDDIAGGTIWLDGAPIAPGDFSSILSSDYSAAVLPVSQGTHTTLSTQEGHGITIEGYNNYDSYIYPGGALFVPINPVNDSIPPVCETISNNGCIAEVVCTDIHDDASGIYAVNLGFGSVNLTLTVTPFALGASEVNYSVTTTDSTLPGAGTVVVRDGDGNTCATEFALECGVSECADIYGQVMADGAGLLSVEVQLFNSLNVMIATMYTDVGGLYRFEEMGSGDYTVEITIPLSMSPVTSPSVMLTLSGIDTEVNFELAAVTPGKFLHMWAWKVYLRDLYEDGPRQDIFTIQEVEQWSQMIFDHFYDRSDGYAIQYPLLTYADDPARPMTFDEIVFAMALDSDRSYATYLRKYLLGTILSVVSGRLDQMKIVSVDGATVSQAITYFSNILQTGDDYARRKAIYDIRNIHLGSLIPAGVIPVCCVGNVMFKQEGSVAGEETLPSQFVLNQNYPNPFNPSTEIAFSLFEASNVQLEVFNLLGKKVTTVFEGNLDAGIHSFTWNGNTAASGIYLYKLTAGDFIQTKKMMLIK